MYRRVSIPIVAAALAFGGLFTCASTSHAWDHCPCDCCCCWDCDPSMACDAFHCNGGFCDWAGVYDGTGNCNCDCNGRPYANHRGKCLGGYMQPIQRARMYNWNRNYAYTDYGQPTALVVPPTAQLQTNWGWGVASSRISRIDHQFQRNYPGAGPFGGRARPTPPWPSDTTQFGIYPVRAPW
jgi:hypothetical protein